MLDKPVSKAALAKARRQFDKAVTKAIPAHVKGTGWRSKYGWPYREHADWIIHQQHMMLSEQAGRTVVSVFAKPMALDDFFWDVADMPGNKSEALSLRMVGAFSAHAPALLVADLPESDDVDEMAERLVNHARKWGDEFEPDAALRQLYEQLDRSQWSHLPHDPDGVAYTCLLALSGRRDEAVDYCRERIAAGDSGGYPTIGKDRTGFYPSAIRWLNAGFDPSAYRSLRAG